MLKVAVLSDTHILSPTKTLIKCYEENFSLADKIIHCGDFGSISTASYFQQHKDFTGVLGNCDMGDIALCDEFQTSAQFMLLGRKCLALHGYGARPTVLASLEKEFAGIFDIVFFGHTHAPNCCECKDTLFINPGSFNEGSYALVSIDEKDISCTFHTVEAASLIPLSIF